MGEVGQHRVHAAELGAQHRLHLAAAEPGGAGVDPAGQAEQHVAGGGVTDQPPDVEQPGQGLVDAVAGHVAVAQGARFQGGEVGFREPGQVPVGRLACGQSGDHGAGLVAAGGVAERGPRLGPGGREVALHVGAEREVRRVPAAARGGKVAEQVLAAARAAQTAALNAKKLAIERAKKAAQLAKKKADEAIKTTSTKAVNVAKKVGNAVQRQVKQKAGPASGGGKKASSPDASNRSSGGSSGPDCKSADNSFVPGTRVLMADGTTEPIEDVGIGDKVLATDPESGETTAETVTAEIKGEGLKHLVKVTVDIDGDEGSKKAQVIATDGHPFWVPELGEWINATGLQSGQWLQTGDGTRVQITAIQRWTSVRDIVHNLTVSDTHTYYVAVGETPVLVHNCSVTDAAKDAARNAPADATMTAASRFRGTDMVETGYSGPSSKPVYLEPEIEAELEHGGQTFAGDAANCAEVRACNALIANHGADFEKLMERPLKLSDIEFITVRSASGVPVPACLSCQSVLVRAGARDLSR